MGDLFHTRQGDFRGADVRPRALLAANSIKGQYGKYCAAYDDQLRSRLLREQAITDGMEAALAEGSLRYICSPSTGLRMTGWPEQKRLYAGTIRNGECSPLRILFLYLKRTVLSPSWINMSGTGPAQC